MPNVTIIFGLLLIAVSLGSYFASDGKSLTSFIPSIVGGIFLICGLIAKTSDSARKHALHAVALISLLGAIAAGMRVPVSLAAYQETEGASPVALIGQTSMTVLCALFFLICLRSFVVARVLKKGYSQD